jgi:hypothetical protein
MWRLQPMAHPADDRFFFLLGAEFHSLFTFY